MEILTKVLVIGLLYLIYKYFSLKGKLIELRRALYFADKVTEFIKKLDKQKKDTACKGIEPETAISILSQARMEGKTSLEKEIERLKT
jgi:hypothetical protein